MNTSHMSTRRRLPIAGHIRPGVKVLTRAAAAVPALVAAYEKGVAQGISFDEIAHNMGSIQGCPKTPLVPKNPPYFTVRQADFSVAGAADLIMQKYGTVRPGDPARRLYAFQIMFPSDDIDLVFREGFEAWKATELSRWSIVEPQTGERLCMKRQEVQPDPKARRRWGGRPIEVDRECDPNDCDLFASGACRHSATLNFWIPGIPGVGCFELSWTSVYATGDLLPILEIVKMGLGRISGLMPDRTPIFWLSKKLRDVNRINWETGKREKSQQWIIQLEASGLNMVEVMSLMPPAPMVSIAAPTQAPAPVWEPEPEPEPAPAPAQKAPTPELLALRKELSGEMKKLGWDADELKAWVIQNFGDETAVQDAGKVRDMLKKLAALKPTPPIEAEPATAEAPF